MFENDKIINYLVEQIEQQLPDSVQRVILFGSRARNDNDIDSDYDCLIVAEGSTPGIIDIIDTISGDILLKFGTIVSMIIVEPATLQNYKYDPLYQNIRHEGITLWQKTA